MPRRDDLGSICLVGSGPIVIGQACEFDYAGCQALKVLREDGFRTIVVNSNPATIMTDPGFADRTYLEPLDLDGVTDVLRRERPDALLPTMGGQTALNLARELARAGVLEELGVELIGADLRAIERAEDRELFKRAVESCGLRVPASRTFTSAAGLDGVSLPAVVRPAFTLGGHGGGFVANPTSSPARSRAGSTRARSARCSWRSRFAGGTNSSSRSSATAPTTSCRLLDREPRPDGRAHRRLRHRRAPDDPLRRGVPGAPRRGRSRSSARSASTPAAPMSSSRATARPASCA